MRFMDFNFNCAASDNFETPTPSAIVGASAAAEYFGSDREVQFVDQAGAEKGVVQFAAAFAEQSFYFPFFAQPLKRFAKIYFARAENFYFRDGSRIFLICR